MSSNSTPNDIPQSTQGESFYSFKDRMYGACNRERAQYLEQLKLFDPSSDEARALTNGHEQWYEGWKARWQEYLETLPQPIIDFESYRSLDQFGDITIQANNAEEFESQWTAVDSQFEKEYRRRVANAPAAGQDTEVLYDEYMRGSGEWETYLQDGLKLFGISA
ncbi:uncharacterized protein I206_107602 [Kwoniella pini CBS 10737]|uniref:Uncharacterized protein n=1 Tax=Kwoniella pini CBS 10737 TaxID=1296096 RepID=A0A1B9HXU9_9TREE|nr:uncharacterized protein I206_05935 [Kwoniella pini CBS 10737]OCF48068.1 hypothetical protein I206_05935 [Kwoniella pini CBS 10737]